MLLTKSRCLLHLFEMPSGYHLNLLKTRRAIRQLFVIVTMLQVSYRGDALYLPVISVNCNYETTSSWVFCSANGVLRTFAFDIGTAMSSMIPKKTPPWPAISEPLSYSTHELLQNLLVGPSPFASKNCSLPKPSA